MLIVVAWLLLQTSPVQNWVVKRVTNKLSRDLGTKISIKHVDFSLFNKMLLQGTLVLDKNNDTLLYAGTAKVNITDWFFLKDNITLKYVGLSDAVIHLKRKDSIWNYQFLVDYFSSPSKKTDTSKNVVKLDLKTVELNNVKVWQQDEWAGQNRLISINKMNLDAEVFDMKNKTIKISSVVLDHPVYAEYKYAGLHPKIKITTPVKASGLQWNEDDWNILLKDLQIKDGSFSIENQRSIPLAGDRFDGQHIIASDVNSHLKNIHLILMIFVRY